MKKKNAAGSAYAQRESVVFADFTDRNRHKHSIKTMLIVISVILVLLVFLAIIVHKFFRVTDIIVDGAAYYDYSTVLENAEMSKGQIIFLVREGNVRSKLVDKLPHIKDVKLEIKLPSEVHIEVEEEVAAYYFEMAGEYFVINSEMKVLDRFTSIEKLSSAYPALMSIAIPDVSLAVTGKTVEFASEFDSAHTDEALFALRAWNRFDSLTEIDLHNRFELQVVYEDRITVEFGTYTDFEGKLKLLEEMIDHYDELAVGRFSLRDVKKGIAWMDDQGDDVYGGASEPAQ